MTNEIVKIKASDYGLEESKAQEIEAMFLPMLAKMKDLEVQYNEVLKQDINPETCQMAKDLRMSYVKTRTGTEKIHKDLKSFYLNGGRFVDAWKNTQLFAASEKEKTLKAIEDHFENQERERLEKLRISRIELLKPYTEIEPMGLAHMEQAVFDNLLSGFKLAFEVRIAAEKKAEEERLAAIEAEKKRQEEMRLENIRLQKEAEKREKQIIAEREKVRKENEERERLAEIERKKQAEILAKQKAESDKKEFELRAKVEAERKERERLETEIEAKKRAVEKQKADQIAAERKAAKAPDKVKLIALSEAISKIELPEVKSEEAKKIVENTLILLQKTVTFIIEKTEML
jgi:colicin import membrane protein